ncbi:MAG: hypothetical protein ACHQIG_11045 [Acidimicrobiia bacterium]
MSAVAPPIGAVARRSRALASAHVRRLATARAGTVVATLVVVGAGMAFAGYRVWQAAAGPPIVWSDSLDYARSAIWAGSRPPLAPMLLAASPTFGWFVAFQTAFALVAWGALAWAVAAHVPSRFRSAAVVIVLAFGSTTAVVRWDRSVLTESLSMSCVALLLAALLCGFDRTTWPRVVALVTAAALFGAARDTDVWIVWALAIAVAVETVVSRRGARGFVAALALAACAGALLGGSLAADRTEPNVEHVYFVRVFPYPDRVDWFAAHGMPDAGVVREYAADASPRRGAAPVVGIDHNDTRVPALVRWLHEEGASTYLRWVLEHPAYLLTEPMQRPERAYNFGQGSLVGYSGPERTELGPVDALLSPAASIVLVAAAAACAVFVCCRRRRTTGARVALLFCVLGLAHMLVAWHGDGMETTRHAAVGNVQARLGVVVLVVLACAELGGRRRGHTAGIE